MLENLAQQSLMREGESGENSMEGNSDWVKDNGITFCLCYVPEHSRIKPTMTNLVLMAGGRWGVEETMSIAKGPIGWGENQFRKWDSLQQAVSSGVSNRQLGSANWIACPSCGEDQKRSEEDVRDQLRIVCPVRDAPLPGLPQMPCCLDRL